MDKKMSVITKVIMVLVVIAICVGIYFISVNILKKSNNDDNSNVDEQVSNEKLYNLEEFPKVDGSTATQPLIKAIMNDFTKEQNIDFSKYNFSKTHASYVKLINDEVDIIVVTSPSQEELDLAKQKGVELEVIPVVNEGFVFYVNSQNKVDNLTTEQIQKIYSGEITNWKEVGGDDEEIKAYQRPVNSGSQTGMISLVMKDKKLMEAPKENLAATMSDIINLVSMYKNGENAIGYSYYYYATTMFQTIDKDVASNIKLLSVDGIEPNVNTIKSLTYPFHTSYYIVINKADDENSMSRKLANQMLSTRGQKVAFDAGYVPVK